MDTDSNYFAFSEDSIEKLFKPEMKGEYENDKCNLFHCVVKCIVLQISQKKNTQRW